MMWAEHGYKINLLSVVRLKYSQAYSNAHIETQINNKFRVRYIPRTILIVRHIIRHIPSCLLYIPLLLQTSDDVNLFFYIQTRNDTVSITMT